MVKKRAGLMLTVCAAVGCVSTPPRLVAQEPGEQKEAAFLKLFSPRCGTAESLEAELHADERLLDVAARDLGLLTADLPTSAWRAGEGLPRAGFLAAVMAGHGLNGMGAASICVEAQPWSPSGLGLGIDELSEALPPTLSGAVLIVNACRSAQVDPRRAKVPLSVISASPFTVRTDAMFGSTLPEALRTAASDPNCDGLVTDQELFDGLTLLLRQRPPLSDRPAFPKLRRNATSEIPLPITPTPTEACRRERTDLEGWIELHAPNLGELGKALMTQSALARGLQARRSVPLPKADHDYFVIDIADGGEANRVRHFLQRSGLRELPVQALDRADRLARYVIFADILRVREYCGWLYLSRLKDDALLATAAVGEALRLPGRQRIEFAASSKQPVYWRSGVVDDHTLVATPCFSGSGQCFEMPTDAERKAFP